MKLVNFLALTIILAFCSCKKENIVKERETLLVTDSVSFTINGEKYISNRVEKSSTLTTESNTKITSGVNFNYLIQGDIDSILFMRNYTIKTGNSFVILKFIKIYNNVDTEYTNENNGSYLFFPKNKEDIFSPGLYKYSTDLWRDNSISGIAIRIINDDGDFKSYGHPDLNKTASVTQADQKDSKFEIISLQKRESDYLLEAKFNLNVFDENKHMLKIENGYLRFSVLKKSLAL